MTVDAKEVIGDLRHLIDNEKESIEYYAKKVSTAAQSLEISVANLRKYEERLAAELSQVSA